MPKNCPSCGGKVVRKGAWKRWRTKSGREVEQYYPYAEVCIVCGKIVSL